MTTREYKKIATDARKTVLRMIYEAQTSHIGSNFSCADLLVVLYNIANVDKDLKEDRDRIVISKGWVAATTYVLLAEKGIIPKEDLETYCRPGSKYIGLAEPSVRGIEAAGGSMGYGLPFGVGFALAKKLKKEKGKVFVLLSDGELQIGTTWESVLIAKQYGLSQLVVLVDNNKWQAMGRTKDILNVEPIEERVRPFGWDVRRIDGHNYEQIEHALQHTSVSLPTMIVCDTIKGKGVKRFEDNNLYHYKELSKEEYEEALHELSNG
ncbi:MAG: transketolase [Patescibacteria group bacterium]